MAVPRTLVNLIPLKSSLFSVQLRFRTIDSMNFPSPSTAAFFKRSRTILFFNGRPRIISINRSSSAISAITKSVENGLSTRFFNVVQQYEDVIGLTAVKEAQKSVLQAERDFERTQESRRSKQDQIRQVQLQLKDIHQELDKCSRGEDRYLDLLTREHSIIKQEKTLVDEFKRIERSERDCFSVLSTRLRESHEKERERAERTKYWSIIGSAIGALLGIAGTTINNRLRIRELRNIVEQSSEPGRVQAVVAQLSDMVRTQQQQVSSFVNDVKGMLNNNRAQWPSALTTTAAGQSLSASEQWLSPRDSSQIMAAIKEQETKMGNDMQEIKMMIAAEHGYSMAQDGTIVYIGPEMRALLDQTERNLEWKLKVNTLAAVVAIYGALALTLPLLYTIFREP